MIPYVQVPDLVLVPARLFHGQWPGKDIAIHPFGALVALGIWVGIGLVVTEARRRHVPMTSVQSYLLWVLVGGFLGGHVFDWCFYNPDSLRADPLSLVRIWDGQSSFGGFIGAGLGSWAWSWKSKLRARGFVELVSSSFPAAWFFGRLGCAVAHDHPGRFSSSLWAVAYPGGGRLDMGLLEALATLPLAIVFLLLRRQRRPAGLFLGLMCTYYAPVRFALDFARAQDLALSDPRYFALTAAQWGCVGLLGLGLTVLAGARTRAMRAGQGSSAPVQKPI